MKAVVYTEYGTPDVLKFIEIEKPVPKYNEVLIRVYASTVSAGVVWMRKGEFPGSKFFTVLLRLQFGITKPRRSILGFEFSGVVEGVGEDVRLFKKGDTVFGTTTGLKNGAYADFVCIPEKRKQGVLALMPPDISFEEAAGLPIGGMTALQILIKAKIKAGEKVLIYGASGSVGTYAVQIAKYLGAHVTAVCSIGNFELVSSIGADEVIDYTKKPITRCKEKFDVIFDAVGKIKHSALRPLLKVSGKRLSIYTLTDEKVAYLDLLCTMLSEGKLKIIIDRIYPFEQIVAAHNYVDFGHKKGNVILRH